MAIKNTFLLCFEYTIFPYNTTNVFQIDLAKALIGNNKDCYVCYQTILETQVLKVIA